MDLEGLISLGFNCLESLTVSVSISWTGVRDLDNLIKFRLITLTDLENLIRLEFKDLWVKSLTVFVSISPTWLIKWTCFYDIRPLTGVIGQVEAQWPQISHLIGMHFTNWSDRLRQSYKMKTLRRDLRHSVTSSFYYSTSQHGDLNALWNSLYCHDFVSISVAQWI